jgi:predicted permease
MPNVLAWIFRRLFPGPIGEEARLDLERDYAAQLERRGPRTANLRFVALFFRPSTWSLALALRRAARRTRPDGARIAWLRRGRGGVVSWIDVKLGLRMLAKYPVMSVVSGFAIALTVAIAIGNFGFFQDFLLRPSVPLVEGDRIVSLGLRTPESSSERRLLHEFFAWRDELNTVTQLSIWRFEDRIIVSPDGRTELARFAMMSASGFEVARVPPQLGRPLLDSDETQGAPAVVVIGYTEWMNRFGADPEIVGRQLRIGRDMHTIVGVMPEGFTFPLAQQLWLPFTDEPDDFPGMEAQPRYFAFGRLAPGVTLDQARAEMTAFTSRRAERYPDTHAHLRSLVMPYTETHTGMDGSSDADILLGRVILGALTLLVLIPFANVAILVYARTATRAGEIAVRNALGASRRRVVTQLFAEALVLATVSAAAGIGIALYAGNLIGQFVGTFFGGSLPFWVKMGRDPWAFAYAISLTLFATVVAGVVPGLQATGKGMQDNLKRASGGNGLRLGKLWTGLVVTQVAITVACLPLVGWVAWQALGTGISRPTFAADEYVGASITGTPLQADETPGGTPSPAGAAIEEIVRRLEADPRVTGVALSNRTPSALSSASLRIEIDGIELPLGQPSYPVSTMAVDAGFFELLGVPILSGREFVPVDVDAIPQPVVVSRAFVEQALAGANPIGRLIRDSRRPDEEPAPWREIVGVVGDLTENPFRPEAAAARIFTPFDRSRMDGAFLTAHVSSSPTDVVPQLGRIILAVDPGLLFGTGPLSAPPDPMRALMLGVSLGIGLVLFSVLLLCTAGVFALISFNVTSRHREIAIRSALGASPRRVLAGVMAHSAKQLSLGVALGFLVVTAMPPFSLGFGLRIQRDPRLIVAVAIVTVAVGLLAAVGPARRGLRIQPTEALREG